MVTGAYYCWADVVSISYAEWYDRAQNKAGTLRDAADLSYGNCANHTNNANLGSFVCH